MSKDLVRAFCVEHKPVMTNKYIHMHDYKVFKKMVSTGGNLDEQKKVMFRFNVLVVKRKKWDDVKANINVSKYVGVFSRRFFKDSIVKLR